MHNKVVKPKHFQMVGNPVDLPNMNAFCDWLSETIVISVYDSFFRNYISMDLFSFIVLHEQPIKAPVHIGTWRPRKS